MVVALLTDFGTADYFVAALKGAMLSISESVRIVDITHDVAAQNIGAASFILRACYRDFPENTVFVAVVDPGVGSDRKAILVETEKYRFVAPDNGLLGFVFEETENYKVYELTNEEFFAPRISRTFHGRDIFAPVAAHLASGVEPHRFGAQIKNFIRRAAAAPRQISEREIEAAIIHCDRFGNLITNLRAEDLPESFTLEVGGQTVKESREFYSEGGADEPFVIAGSAGFLEIVAFQSSARAILRADVGDKITLKLH